MFNVSHGGRSVFSITCDHSVELFVFVLVAIAVMVCILLVRIADKQKKRQERAACMRQARD